MTVCLKKIISILINLMAATLFRSRLVSYGRIGSALSHNRNFCPLDPLESLYNSPKPPSIKTYDPNVYFVKNDDIPHSMFMRLGSCPDLPLDRYACNRFMQEVFLDPPISQPAAARHCLAHMILRGALPNLDTFTILVKSYCKDFHLTYQHIHHLIFTQMKAVEEVEPDDSFHQTLVDAVCARFGPVLGYHLLKDLTSNCPIHVLLPLSCYNEVVRHFCKRKMVEDEVMVSKLIDLLIHMKQQHVFPDEKIFKYLRQGCGHGGEGFLKAMGIGREMLALGIKIKEVSCIIVKK